MIKNLILGGLVMASVSAMAQSNDWNHSSYYEMKNERKMKLMDENLPISEKRMLVVNEARKMLRGGDAYAFTSMMDRVPTPVGLAITEGIFNANREALCVCDEKIASMSPGYVTSYTTSGTDGTTTTVTTTYAMENRRPMRLVMDQSNTPKDIDYVSAISILTDGQDATQAGIVSDWWHRTATEREKDTIVRLLELSANMGDAPIYPSVYSRHSTTWSSNP